MLVYRAHFITNIFKIKSIIDTGVFLVNGEKKYYVNHNVRVGELVQVDPDFREDFIEDMYFRLREGGKLIFRRPVELYLFVNYSIMFIFFVRSPRRDEIYFPPLRLDPYIGGDLYYL